MLFAELLLNACFCTNSNQLGEIKMSVHKRTWKNSDGSRGEAWIVAYADQGGTRRTKNFERKRDADAFHASVSVDMRKGIHVPDSQSVTVAEAARIWLDACAGRGLERATLAPYRQHVDLHIVPLIGAVKLSILSTATVRAFEDRLRKDRSPAMVRKIRVSLSSILTEAMERGLVAQNVMRGLRHRRQGRATRSGGTERPRNGKLRVGVDIPTPEEVRAIIAHLKGRWRPLFLTAIFTGLRASELRGLRWEDVDLKRGELHVRQRADRYRAIGLPKSEAGERTVPLPPLVINTLKERRLAQPKSDLVFPNREGRVEDYTNILRRGFKPVLVAAGIVDKHGRAKYPGLHALRHFYASWCINRRVDGGLELPLKVVQARLGHATIQMTADTYGHLFPRGDDGSELAAAEQALLA
jgi:integrase